MPRRAGPGGALVEVDALGLLCPLPILRARDAARRVPPGAGLILWADDDAIVTDLPAWCQGQGHVLASLRRERHPGGFEAWRGEIRLGPDTASRGPADDSTPRRRGPIPTDGGPA